MQCILCIHSSILILAYLGERSNEKVSLEANAGSFRISKISLQDKHSKEDHGTTTVSTLVHKEPEIGKQKHYQALIVACCLSFVLLEQQPE
jgi:hypothetical protein